MQKGVKRMEDLGTTLALQLTPQILFSMLGAFIGALISADVRRYGIRLTVLFIIVAAVVGGAISDYLVQERGILQVWVLFALNVPTGMVVGTTLDVVRIASPRLIEQVVNKAGDSAAEAIQRKVDRVFGSDTKPNINSTTANDNENN